MGISGQLLSKPVSFILALFIVQGLRSLQFQATLFLCPCSDKRPAELEVAVGDRVSDFYRGAQLFDSTL